MSCMACMKSSPFQSQDFMGSAAASQQGRMQTIGVCADTPSAARWWPALARQRLMHRCMCLSGLQAGVPLTWPAALVMMHCIT